MTTSRVILLKGSQEAINMAQATIWNILASSHASKGGSEEATISGQLLVPDTASGLLIGKAGATIKKIATDCGVTCALDSKDETLLGERIMSISGHLDGCIAAVSMVLDKFSEDMVASEYANKTTKVNSVGGMFAHKGSSSSGSGGSSSGRYASDMNATVAGLRILSAQSTIVLAVADTAIGSVLGVKVIEYSLHNNHTIGLYGPYTSSTAYFSCAESALHVVHIGIRTTRTGRHIGRHYHSLF